MAYVRYKNFGDLGKLIRKFDDPTETIKKAKAEKAKKEKVLNIFDTITSPLQTVLRKAVYRQTTEKTISDEEKVRAIVIKVLIENGLI